MCVDPFSSTNTISSLFLVFCRFLRTSTIMFKMMTIYVPSAEETRCYQPSKNIKIQCGIEGNVMKKECSGGCSGKAARQFQEILL